MAEVKDPPLGTITVYAGNFVPDLQTWEEDHGWMLCDGRLLDRTVYAAMKRCLQVVLLTLAFLSQTVIAQDADVCRELLKFGIFDSEDTLSASQNHILLQDFFCTDQSRDLATAKQRAQRSGISLGVFEIKLSGSDDSTTSEQTYEKWRNRMCHLQATEAQDQLLLKTEARRVARALMDGFTRCVELRSSSPGLISFIETTKERRQVFFKAKFIQDSGEGPIAIRSITVSTVPASAHTCDFSEWTRGERIGAREKTLLCTVEPTNTVTFLLSARRSGSGSSETTTKILEGVTRPEPIPVISGFRVDPPSLDSGQSADLIWNVEGAGRVLLSPDPSGASQQAVSVPSEGRVKITPAITTTYSLQAFGPTGQTDVKTTSVVVSIPPPRIISATFNPPEVFVGNQRSELSWEASGSTSAVIVEGIGSFTGRTGRVMVGPISDDKEFVVTAVRDERIHNPDHHTIVLHKKVRAVGFQAIGFGTDDPAHARPIQIFTNQHLPPEWRNQISSIQVLTNEWVILHKMNDFSFCFALKGPKNYDNLHNIRLELGPRFFTFSIHAGDFAEAIDFSATEPTNCQTRLR